MQKNLYMFCEGMTEYLFVSQILAPYFLEKYGVVVIPVTVPSRVLDGVKYSGGISTYGKLKQKLYSHCREHSHAYVSTMIDYYGLLHDTPGLSEQGTDLYDTAAKIEAAIMQDMGCSNLIFNLTLHEFEAYCFVKPDIFYGLNELIPDCLSDRRVTAEQIAQIQRVRDCFPTPEHINNSVQTAPSKRLIKILGRAFDKVSVPEIMDDNGVDVPLIKQQCRHFREWIEKLEKLPWERFSR